MASSPIRTNSPNELSDHSTADDSSFIGYPLTRQPGRTTLRHNDTFPFVSSESKQFENTTETKPGAPTSPETYTVNHETMTMKITLDDVELVQLFLRADGSIKGISFNYKDSDFADLGCCVAEPDCWYAFYHPHWLLFRPTRGHRLDRGFFPVETICFADTHDDVPESKMRAIRMQDSLMFRVSPNGLDIGIEFGPGKSTFERAKEAFEEWFGRVFVLSRLSTKVRDIGKKGRRLTKRKMRRELEVERVWWK